MGRVHQTRPCNIGCTEEKNINFNGSSRFHSALSPPLDAQKNKIIMDVAKNPSGVSHKMRHIRLYPRLLMALRERGSLNSTVILQRVCYAARTRNEELEGGEDDDGVLPQCVMFLCNKVEKFVSGKKARYLGH